MTEKSKESGLISIGGLGAACNIPVETLRNWELRYGFPTPKRLQSGHRRYKLSLIPRLKKIKALVNAGHKPSFAVTAEESELDQLLRSSDIHTDVFDTIQSGGRVPAWMQHVEQMNGTGLMQVFSRDWNAVGARRFIFEHALPYLVEVGKQWESGQLSVAHEHFATEVLQSFLSSRWRPLLRAGHDRRVLLANQEGDLHSLGLQMSAVLATLHNIEPIFLGPNTPFNDILAAATEQKVDAVVIGLSVVSDPASSEAFLMQLSKGLIGVRIAFGGNDQLPDLSNIEYIPTLEDFDKWCQSL